MDLRPGDKVDIPVDTGEAEHVLILQIAAVTPFVDLDRDHILTFHQVFGDVELGIVVRALAVTYFLPIDPDIEGRVNPVEMEEYLLTGPVRGQGEVPPVGPCRIRLRKCGVTPLGLDEGRIIQERICAVGIQRSTVALHFPIGRHVYLIPSRDIVLRGLETNRTVIGISYPVEFPLPIEKHVS